tara:strand:- start:288 stop:863 length:576 start_codon:yes stop_codon:yes gene_type:complete
MILKRSLILGVSCLIYIILNLSFSNLIIENKKNKIYNLETKHKTVNEKFITAQILSKSLENVYTIFETNLAMSKNDIKNKEASMEFLKYLTDIMEKYNIKLNQIIPGKKTSKGSLTNIPYDIHIVCDYEKLGEFINEIESSDRIILINELTIKNNIEKIKSNKKDQNISDQEIEIEIQTVTINKSKEYNES